MSPRPKSTSQATSPPPTPPSSDATSRYLSLAGNLRQNRSDMLISFARGLFFAFIVFTFLAGIIFTVIPLIRSVSDYLTLVIAIPIGEWVRQEPVTGPMTMFLFYASGAMLVFYILRNHFHLVWLWLVMKWHQLNKTWISIPGKKKTSTNGTNSVQLSSGNPPSR